MKPFIALHAAAILIFLCAMRLYFKLADCSLIEEKKKKRNYCHLKNSNIYYGNFHITVKVFCSMVSLPMLSVLFVNTMPFTTISPYPSMHSSQSCVPGLTFSQK